VNARRRRILRQTATVDAVVEKPGGVIWAAKDQRELVEPFRGHGVKMRDAG
jgi:hypothetical protein